MTIAPTPGFPESADHVFERTMGSERRFPGGPRRFEEGVARDTDVPNDFSRGSSFDPSPAPGTQSDPNPEMVFKHAADTMRERAHVGSAAWVEAPTVLQDFAVGARSGQTPPQFELENNPGTKMNRPAASRVSG